MVIQPTASQFTEYTILTHHHYVIDTVTYLGFVIMDGFWIGFIYALSTALGTICNYSTIADTLARVLSLLHSPLSVSWQRILKREL
jgi:hypothetical protein